LRAPIPLIIARYPLLKGMDVPAQAYAGIKSPLPTVGSVNLALDRADLNGARAQAFVTAMRQAGPELTATLAQGGGQQAGQHPGKRTFARASAADTEKVMSTRARAALPS